MPGTMNSADPGAMPLLRSHATRLDRVGIAASLACSVHCMVAPILLLAAPALGQAWSDPLVHWLLAIVTLPAAAWVLLRGYRQHRRHLVAVLAVAGMLGILVGLVLPVVAGGADPAPVASAGAGGAACAVSGCCPSVAVDAQSGAYSLVMPAASWGTLIGSVCLVLAHAGNLWSCRCCRSHARCGGGWSPDPRDVRP